MNLSKPLRSARRLLHILFLRSRFLLPPQQCTTFGGVLSEKPVIGPIFVINLDRQPHRWGNIVRELDCIRDGSGEPLSKRAIRYSACDGQTESSDFFDTSSVDPLYTLGDQLFVEPQPLAVPDEFDLMRPIRMSRAEVAVARSHIGVWKEIAQSSNSYTLVIEDDVWFERRFGRVLEQAWREMEDADLGSPGFDILYVSYEEVRYGAPKELLSKNIFRPERGLWYLSGYILSKKGAQALLALLPCRGPIDLWLNHKFCELEVRALRSSVINQRRDLHSTNSYSILPALSRIGILDSGDAALFHQKPLQAPVFAFGSQGAGLSSLAMALSMLGYRCCSDLDDIPKVEFETLLAGQSDRIFDAYVNIGSLGPQIQILRRRYPHAKYILMREVAESVDVRDNLEFDALEGADVLYLHRESLKGWSELCEHLRIAPPDAKYPTIPDIGMRRYERFSPNSGVTNSLKRLQHDPSPWIAKPRENWAGISVSQGNEEEASTLKRMYFDDELDQIRTARWLLRNDTFPGNLGLFRPANVIPVADGGLSLAVYKEPLGVRTLSAASLSSRESFLFGRFQATLQATNVPGLVTGFFLHRDSPRQEIDVEILGKQPDQILVNVFYNPGSDGAKFDYGYRGTPTVIQLGFDASKTLHHYAIEWDPCEIRWFVDQKLVHRRVMWDPTPIPHLPMKLHVNTWPARSREFAGRLPTYSLPASAILRRITVDAFVADAGAENQPSTATIEEFKGSLES